MQEHKSLSSVMRQRGAYAYLDTNLHVLHSTSVPTDDEHAVRYVVLVEEWFPQDKVRFIQQRAIREREYFFLDLEVVDGKPVYRTT